MPTWVCLLRAVNLGSHNKVSMARLREALTEAGYADVRTYVQSGNVVLYSPVRTPAKVSAGVGDVLRESFGVDTPVLVRSPQQLEAIADWNPFATQVDERPTSVHVVHLVTDPDPVALEQLLATDWGGDRLAARGLELVVAYDDSMQGSRLQLAAVAKRLGATGTARNWRTLRALVDLASA